MNDFQDRYLNFRYQPDLVSSEAFIGREPELESIKAELYAKNRASISGGEGVGKTTLAGQVAGGYKTVVWFDYGKDIVQQYWLQEDQATIWRGESLTSRLDRDASLIIFDNASESILLPEGFEWFNRSGPTRHILQVGRMLPEATVSLQPLTLDERVTLLLRPSYISVKDRAFPDYNLWNPEAMPPEEVKTAQEIVAKLTQILGDNPCWCARAGAVIDAWLAEGTLNLYDFNHMLSDPKHKDAVIAEMQR